MSNVWHDGHNWLLEDDLLLGLAQKHKGIEACGLLDFWKMILPSNIGSIDEIDVFAILFVFCSVSLMVSLVVWFFRLTSLQQDLLHTLMTFMERQSDLFHVKDLRVVYVLVPVPRYSQCP